METIHNLMIRLHTNKTYLIWTKTYLFWGGGVGPKPLKIFTDPMQLLKFLDPLVAFTSSKQASHRACSVDRRPHSDSSRLARLASDISTKVSPGTNPFPFSRSLSEVASNKQLPELLTQRSQLMIIPNSKFQIRQVPTDSWRLARLANNVFQQAVTTPF